MKITKYAGIAATMVSKTFEWLSHSVEKLFVLVYVGIVVVNHILVIQKILTNQHTSLFR